MNFLKYSACCIGISAIGGFGLVAITDSFSLGWIGGGIYSLVMLELIKMNNFYKAQELSSKEVNNGKEVIKNER